MAGASGNCGKTLNIGLPYDAIFTVCCEEILQTDTPSKNDVTTQNTQDEDNFIDETTRDYIGNIC